MKRFVSLCLIFVIITAQMFTVIGADSLYEIEGSSVIVIPQNTEGICVLDYSLVLSGTSEKKDAEFSLETVVDGIYISKDGKLIVTESAQAGNIVLIASYNNQQYSKQVSLINGWYEDFEDYANGDTRNITDNTTVAAGYWQGVRAGTISSDSNGNIYLNTVLGSQKYSRYYLDETIDSEQVVVECDIRPATQSSLVNMYTATKSGKALYTMLFNSEDNYNIGYKIGSDGNSCSTAYLNSYLSGSTWNKLKFELDLVNGKYNVIVNDEKIIDGWKMNVLAAEPQIAMLDFYNDIDNINIYSGKQVDGSLSAQDATLILPENDKTSSVKLTSTALIDGVSYTDVPVKWSLKEDYSGVSISGDKLIASSDASVGVVSLTGNFGHLTVEKDIELVNPTIRLSLSDEKLNISALPEKEYLVSVYAPSSSAELLDRFTTPTDKDDAEARVYDESDVTTGLDGNCEYSLSGLEAGTYNIYVKDKETEETANIKYICSLSDLLASSDATNESDFADFLSEYGVENANYMQSTYLSLSDKEYAIQLTNGDISLFGVATCIAAMIEENSFMSVLGDYVESVLDDINLDSSFVYLAEKNADYIALVSAVKNDDISTLDKVVASFYKHSILCGVKNAEVSSDAKPFVEALNLDKYDNARETQKDYITQNIYKKDYTSLESLITAINELDITSVRPDCVVNGNSQIAIPKENNKISVVKYSLFDNDLSENIVANYSVTGDTDTLFITPSGELVVTNNTSPGTVCVNADYDGNTYTKEVTLVNGYYEDFEAYAENDTRPGGNAAAGQWYYKSNVDGKGIVCTDGEGNQYLYTYTESCTDWSRYYLSDVLHSEHVVFEFDVKAEDIGDSGEKIIAYLYNSSGKALFNIGYDMSNGKVFTKNDSTGSSISTTYLEEISISETEWNHFKFELNLSDNTYSMYFNENKIIDSWKMVSGLSGGYDIKFVQLYTYVDNINIYSGKLGEAVLTSAPGYVPIPKENETFELKLEASLVSGSDAYGGVPVVWSLADAYTGVKISGNKLLVSSNAISGTVNINGSFGGMTLEKTIHVYTPTIYLDIKDEKLEISADANTSYKVFIYCPEDSGELIDRFLLSSTIENEEADYIERSLTTNSNGINRIDLSFLSDGNYNIYVQSSDETETAHIEYLRGIMNLLSDTPSVASHKFISLLEKYEVKDAKTVQSTYISLRNRNLAQTLCENKINLLPASSAIVSVLEQNKNNISINDFAKATLSELGIDTKGIDLLSFNTSYSEVTDAVISENNVYLVDVASSLKKNAILCGIKNVANKRDAVTFLAHAGSLKYNSASNDGKLVIADAVAKKSYESLESLNAAIDLVNLSNPSDIVKPGPSGVPTSTGSSSGVSAPGVSAPVSVAVFTDVPSGHWAKDAIEILYKKKILSGYDGTFRPDDTLTRAEMAKIIAEAGNLSEGVSSFSDVSSDDWYYPYVSAAFGANLINGYDGKFNPHENITRQDAAVILYRLFAGKIENIKDVSFSDRDDIASYANEAIASLSKAGIINGYEDGSFKPKNNISRAEISQLMLNCITLWEGESNE